METPHNYFAGYGPRLGDGVKITEHPKPKVPEFLPGDMARVKPMAFFPKLAVWAMNKCLYPHCDYFHHFTIRTYIPDEDDYEIKEAIGSGMKDGRLSWYKDYEVYRSTDLRMVFYGSMACAKYSRYGRAKYDFILFVKVFFGVIGAEFHLLRTKHHFRKVHPSELHFGKDDEFVCTEAVYEISYLQAQLAGNPYMAILPPDVVSIPPAIQWVINHDTKLMRIK